MKKIILGFLLQLREKHKVADTFCEFISNSLLDMLDINHRDTAKKFKKRLTEAKIDISNYPGLRTILQSPGGCFSAFENVSSQRKINSHVTKSENFVKPIEYVLGQDENGRPDTIWCVWKITKFYYVRTYTCYR